MQTSQYELRRLALAARRGLGSEERARLSAVICHRFVNSRYFYRARHIAIYLASNDEVDTDEIILRSWSANKHVYAPVIEKKSQMNFVLMTPGTKLVFNRYGLPEPESGERIPVNKLDVVVSPLVAFDENKQRIGMGGGYYDRKLAFLKHRRQYFHPRLVGLGFSCQRVEKIPVNPWDIPLYDCISDD